MIAIMLNKSIGVEKGNSGTVAVIVLVCVIINPLIFVLAIMPKSPDVAVDGILNDSKKFPSLSDCIVRINMRFPEESFI